jgi:hypothetical protein
MSNKCFNFIKGETVLFSTIKVTDYYYIIGYLNLLSVTSMLLYTWSGHMDGRCMLSVWMEFEFLSALET